MIGAGKLVSFFRLSARVIQLSDGEYALIHVSGHFDEPEEREQFTLGARNTAWADYEADLDQVEIAVRDFAPFIATESEPAIDPDNVAGLLELHLDSTEIAPDGTVYLIKRRIASVGDLEIQVYPQDHEPPHFHVTSKQRGIDARFSLETLELLSTKHGAVQPRDVRKIREFFEKRQDMLEKLRSECQRMK
jgi:hypothetical protein